MTSIEIKETAKELLSMIAAQKAEIEIQKKDLCEMEKQLLDIVNEKEETLNPPHKMWKPEFQETYHHAADSESTYTFVNDYIDCIRYDLGLMYKTKEEAQEEAERLKTLKEMREWAGKWDDPWRIVYIANNIRAVSVYSGKGVTYGELRFACQDDAENCIRVIGEDRIKKYYFRIPDNEEEGKTDDRE